MPNDELGAHRELLRQVRAGRYDPALDEIGGEPLAGSGFEGAIGIIADPPTVLLDGHEDADEH